MMFRARVFLDTAAVKHSIRSRTVLSPRRHSLNVGERLHEFVVHEIIDIDPTASVQPGQLRTEIDLLSEVARRAKAGDIELLWQYSRLLSPPASLSGETSRSLRTDFLNSIDHPRFLELQRACGALQGDHVNENQLVDAFHIWCAEAAEASHFLTTDFKLARLVRGHGSVAGRSAAH